MDAETSDRPRNFNNHLTGFLIVFCVVIIAIGLLLPAVSRSGCASKRLVSSNNMRQLGVCLNDMGNTFEGKLPPAYTSRSGTFMGKSGSFFTFALPNIEQSNIFNQLYPNGWKNVDGYHQIDPDNAEAIAAGAMAIKTYYAPLDNSNPGNNNQISYWCNASALKPVNEGEGYGAKYPESFNQKGITQVVIFGERYSETSDAVFRWSDTVTTKPETRIPANSIWGANTTPEGALRSTVIAPAPVMTATYINISGVNNQTAHAYSAAGFLVGMADASSRSMSTLAAGNYSAYGTNATSTIFNWACDPGTTVAPPDNF